MRVKHVGHSGVEVAAARRDPHAGDVEVGPVHVDAEVRQHGKEQLQGLRMVDEARLQGGRDLHEALHRQIVLRADRIERMEGLLDQLARPFGERLGARTGREHEDVPLVESLPAAIVCEGESR